MQSKFVKIKELTAMQNQNTGSSTSIAATNFTFESRIMTNEVKDRINLLTPVINELIGSPDHFFGCPEPYAIMAHDLIFSDDQRIKGKSFYCCDRVVQVDRTIEEMETEKLAECCSEWNLLIWKYSDNKGIALKMAFIDSSEDIIVTAEDLIEYGFMFDEDFGWKKADK